MTDRITVYGHRVRQARTIRSSAIKPLAQLLELSPSAWTSLERSQTTELPALRVRALAVALRFPMKFFQTPPGPPIHRGSLLFRAKKSIKASEVDVLTTFSEMVQELLSALAKTATQPPVRLPLSLPPGCSAAEAARRTREALDLPPDEPIAHIIHTAERAGVLVVVADVELADARHDAISVWIGDFQEQPLIVALPINSWERTRWSVAHEMGHLVLHRGMPTGDLEEDANLFANEFLLPEQALRSEWPSAVTLTTLMPLKRRWQMSLASLIMHGRSHGLIEPDRAEGLFKQLSARKDIHTGVTWRVQEPGWADQNPERPRLLAAMTERGLDIVPSAELFSSLAGDWAEDLMAEIVAGQRPAPEIAAAQARGARALSAPKSNVVPLHRRA